MTCVCAGLFDAVFERDDPRRIWATVVVALCKVACVAVPDDAVDHDGHDRQAVASQMAGWRSDALVVLKRHLECPGVRQVVSAAPVSRVVKCFLFSALLKCMFGADERELRLVVSTVQHLAGYGSARSNMQRRANTWRDVRSFLDVFPHELSSLFSCCVSRTIASSTVSPLDRRLLLLDTLVGTIDAPASFTRALSRFDVALRDEGGEVVAAILDCLVPFSSDVAERGNLVMQRHVLNIVQTVCRAMFDAASAMDGSCHGAGGPQHRRSTWRAHADECIRNDALSSIEGDPTAIALLLLSQCHRVSAASLGEYLGGTRPAADRPNEETLRRAYLRGFAYPADDVIGSMRVLLGDTGFSLPVETQKIERILNTFATVVLFERNPSRFPTADSAMVLTFLLLLVNTGLQNPNVKQ